MAVVILSILDDEIKSCSLLLLCKYHFQFSFSLSLLRKFSRFFLFDDDDDGEKVVRFLLIFFLAGIGGRPFNHSLLLFLSILYIPIQRVVMMLDGCSPIILLLHTATLL